MEYETKQKKIDEDRFLKMREEVLSLWPTGKEVDLQEAIEYQRNLPDNKSFFKVTKKLKKEGRTAIFPRGGTPILEDAIKLCKTMSESGVPFIPVTSDSYSRMMQLEKVQEGLESSIKLGKPMLNGYPVINHGVKNNRKLVESCPGAFNPRLSRLSLGIGSEIAFASGMTAISSSPFFRFGSYEKTATLEDSIKSSQYAMRLMGYYAERGPILTTDLHGWIPSGVYPWSVNIATGIADALIAAEQGVKSIIPWSHLEGCMAQDLAWVNVTRRLYREFLDKYGYTDVETPGLFVAQIPLFPAPQNMGEAFAYLNYSAIVAAIADVEAVFVRTIDEGAGVPTNEAHELSYRSANWILEVLKAQEHDIEMQAIGIEEELTEMEVRAILERLFELGDGDIVIGSIKGVNAGIVDSPFCPNQNALDKVLGVRDCKGACRYAEFGNLPIPEEAKEFHREKIREREHAEGRKMDYRVSVEDFWAFNRGKMLGTSLATKKEVFRRQQEKVREPVKSPTVITGTVGMDAHVIGTKILSRALHEAGFNVVELGCLTSTEDFIDTALETDADAILMSSLYGMAELDVMDFKEKTLEAGLGDVLLYIGGILGVGRHEFKEDEEKFKKMGFDRVYPSETDLDLAIQDLWNDLEYKGKVKKQ